MPLRHNKGTGNTSPRDLWQTPQKLFDRLNSQYHFKVDCCASKDNFKCKKYFEDFEKILKVPQVAWINPPFSNAYAMFDHFFKVVQKGVGIFRCDNMETKIWQNLILKNATWVFIPNRRIVYEGLNGGGAVFGSALIGYNVDPPKLIGTVLEVVDHDYQP